MWKMPAVKILDHCIDSVLSNQCFLQTKNCALYVVIFFHLCNIQCLCLIINRAETEKVLLLLCSKLLLSIPQSMTTASFLSYFNPSVRDFKNCVYLFLGVVIGEVSIFHYYHRLFFFSKRNFDFLILEVIHIYNIFRLCRETKEYKHHI